MALGFVFALADGIEHLPGNLAPEAIGIAVTVLVIDWLYSRQTEESEKRRILGQISSPSNDFALEALRLARKQGWLSDGLLKGADLTYANLSGAYLDGADLSGADLSDTNLSNANLIRTDLSFANLSGANLDGANLDGADLSGANLVLANLRGPT